MQPHDQARQDGAPPQPTPDATPIASLRDRTDEMELIISGLTTYALFSLPGWLLGRYVEALPHLSVPLAIGADVSLTIVSGLCYALGAFFLVHLLARTYWVGLIGLKTVFPGGIDWRRTPGMGPIQRRFYQDYLPDLGTAIARVDRFASSLFSVIGLVTLTMLWIGALMIGSLAMGGWIGSQYGATQQGIQLTTLLVVVLGAGLPSLTWAMDALAARVAPQLARRSGFRAVITALTRAYGLFFPQRLMLPIQLTLQSNTRPHAFVLALSLGSVLLILSGSLQLRLFRDFTLSSEYALLSGQDVREGLRSSHYEDQRSDSDRLRLLPMIPTLRQDGGFVPLFIPYFPLRDREILERLCAESDELRGVDCLTRLWAVELNGRPLPMDSFLPSERRDLGLRGITGFVPTTGLAPGLHRIRVTWNPEAEDDAPPHDDRLDAGKAHYSIPFLFDPGFERGLDEPATAPEPEPPPAAPSPDPPAE